ncbi:MAG: dUTP diphosphatase [Candidatus Moranbacteria bacterium]|nr:dUTP diphosphatase [Candidatus Moranbacteria bacterium]
MIIKIRKTNPDTKIPQYALKNDAGMDLFSDKKVILKPGQRKSIPTGVAIKIEEGFAGLIWDKSGLAHKSGLKTLGGVIDSNYTGEWFVGIINLSQEKICIKKGQKIAQVLFQEIEHPQVEIVTELKETNRGYQAFGSTGK